MLRKCLFLILLTCFITFPVYAAPTTASLETSINLVWVMLGAILVFFMHAGFAMVEVGFTRAKNSLNILMKNLFTICIGSLLFYFVGYGLMFGTSSSSFIGTNSFMLNNVEDIGFFIFQAMFVATCATIISGAVAERIKLSVYLFIVIAMTAFIYPVVGHWVWQGNGWLTDLGFVDFAGSTVVHLTGATGALIAVLLLGPRLGKYSENKINVIQGHNIPIAALGVFILWLGWFGFNGGSSMDADPAIVPSVIGTTLLSTSASLVTSSFYSKLRFKRVDASLSLNGVLGGLVGITAGCAEISLTGSIIVGVISGIILVEGIHFLDTKLQVDDPVGAITVHGICGIWGTLSVGLFSTSTGLFYGHGIAQLGVQAMGVIAVIIWTMTVMGVLLSIVSRITSLRVSKEEEIAGLDFTEHGSNAYEFKEAFFSTDEEPFSHGLRLAERLNNLPKSEEAS